MDAQRVDADDRIRAIQCLRELFHEVRADIGRQLPAQLRMSAGVQARADDLRVEVGSDKPNSVAVVASGQATAVPIRPEPRIVMVAM